MSADKDGIPRRLWHLKKGDEVQIQREGEEVGTWFFHSYFDEGVLVAPTKQLFQRGKLDWVEYREILSPEVAATPSTTSAPETPSSSPSSSTQILPSSTEPGTLPYSQWCLPKPKNAKEEFFIPSAASGPNKFKCNIVGCGHLLTWKPEYKSYTNLETHVTQQHPQQKRVIQWIQETQEYRAAVTAKILARQGKRGLKRKANEENPGTSRQSFQISCPRDVREIHPIQHD